MSSVELLDSYQALLKVKEAFERVKHRFAGGGAVSRNGLLERFDAAQGLLQLTERLPQTMGGLLLPKVVLLCGARTRAGLEQEIGPENGGNGAKLAEISAAARAALTDMEATLTSMEKLAAMGLKAVVSMSSAQEASAAAAALRTTTTDPKKCYARLLSIRERCYKYWKDDGLHMPVETKGSTPHDSDWMLMNMFRSIACTHTTVSIPDAVQGKGLEGVLKALGGSEFYQMRVMVRTDAAAGEVFLKGISHHSQGGGAGAVNFVAAIVTLIWGVLATELGLEMEVGNALQIASMSELALQGLTEEKAASLELSDWIKRVVGEKKRPQPEPETANKMKRTEANNEKTTPNTEGAGARQDKGRSQHNKGAYLDRRKQGLCFLCSGPGHLARECPLKKTREQSLAAPSLGAGASMAPVGWGPQWPFVGPFPSMPPPRGVYPSPSPAALRPPSTAGTR